MADSVLLSNSMGILEMDFERIFEAPLFLSNSHSITQCAHFIFTKIATIFDINQNSYVGIKYRPKLLQASRSKWTFQPRLFPRESEFYASRFVVFELCSRYQDPVPKWKYK